MWALETVAGAVAPDEAGAVKLLRSRRQVQRLRGTVAFVPVQVDGCELIVRTTTFIISFSFSFFLTELPSRHCGISTE